MAGNTDNSTPAATIDFSNLASMKLPGGVVFAPSGVTGLSSGAPVYNAAGVLQTGAHTVEDTIAASAGNAVVTLSGAAAFTSSSSYRVVTTLINAIGYANVVYTSGTSFTISTYNTAGGLISCPVNFIAVGN